MAQLALPFAWPAAEDERDFIVSDANRAAVRHLEHRALWPVQATILTGPRKSGRSTLARIFAAKSGGTLADDAERQDEERLFHLWNRAQAERRPLLIVADHRPPAWSVRLPDLRSRLAATPVIAIDDPDDALVPELVARLLARRNLPASPELLAYLSRRIERSYVGILRAVDLLDEVALQRRSAITVPVARTVLQRLGALPIQEALPVIDDAPTLG